VSSQLIETDDFFLKLKNEYGDMDSQILILFLAIMELKMKKTEKRSIPEFCHQQLAEGLE